MPETVPPLVAQRPAAIVRTELGGVQYSLSEVHMAFSYQNEPTLTASIVRPPSGKSETTGISNLCHALSGLTGQRAAANTRPMSG
jgi:hypothetical protein